jgi:hypothetical protein
VDVIFNWSTKFATQPILVIVVKNPRKNILEEGRVIAQVRNYMLLVRNVYGLGHIFSVVHRMAICVVT